MTPTSRKSTRKRLRFQFSLRSLLLAILVVAVWLGWYCDRARRQKESVALITTLGGRVYYDYELVNGKYDPQAESWVPAWLRSRLGDDFFHGVVHGNMVYHHEKGKRLENDQTTDAALHHLAGFPRLRRLGLQGSQATDEGLAYVGRLKHLEELFMWDASEVSDAGIAHLSKLERLKYIHCSNSQITDESLRILAGLPQIEGLSLQGNRFTDKGLAYVERNTGLKQLVVGLGETDITDDGIRHLSGLVNLELLGLQGTNVTSKGLEHLKRLENLKAVWLGGSQVTDTDAVQNALPNCQFQK